MSTASTARPTRTAYLGAAAMFLVTLGCGETEPVLLPSGDVHVQSELSLPEGSDPVVVVTTTTAESSGQVAGVEAATNPPLTSSSISEPAPPLTLTGAEPTTPTTRPAPVASTVATTTTTTAAAAPSSAAAATTATTTPPTVTSSSSIDPNAGTATPSGIVEFRIPSGTQGGPWNTFDAPVRVTVGQTLRVYNDDVVAHTIHSTGAPFEHGPTIQPGQFADHPIVKPLTPDRAAPANYEHDAGTGAPFWVVATPPDQGSTGAAVPPNTATDGSAELVAAESESLRLLNGLRADLGIQMVAPSDPEMQSFARAWALEMRRTGFRHSSPAVWFENIVWYSDETMTPAEAAARFHDMWVNSPGHYRNMTNPDWSVVGVGLWHDETGWWGVHVFR